MKIEIKDKRFHVTTQAFPYTFASRMYATDKVARRNAINFCRNSVIALGTDRFCVSHASTGSVLSINYHDHKTTKRGMYRFEVQQMKYVSEQQ